MILTRLQIENYKQYQGSHDIDVPALATIGVIGENGAGKTTLFEAIEWCLYSPRGISPSDVRPRGYTGHTSVIVHLESTDGTRRFLVERVLKRTPSAAIYRLHESGEMEPVVQGTRQVSDYVAAKLIGLSHTAFTATFFTRQKELHLFGDQTPSKRREEVGRLLGLETIRTAQKSIIADRSKAAAEARAMQAQYERESQGRDLKTELAAAGATIEERKAQLATDAAAVKSTEGACAAAEAAVATALERRDQDNALGQQLVQLARERQGLADRATRASDELRRLEGRDAERTHLVPIAAALESLRDRIVEQERERVRFDQVADLERALRECAQRQREIDVTVRDVVGQVTVSETHAGWAWSADDSLKPMPGMRRLLAVVESVDLTVSELHERRLRDAHRTNVDRDKALETLERYRQAREELVSRERGLTENGDPGQRIPAIDRERERLLHERTVLHAQRTSLEDDRDRARTILRNLDEQQFGDGCPTCGRPFSSGDAAIVAEAMRQRTNELSARIVELTRETGEIEVAIGALEDRRKHVFAEIETLDELRNRIQKSVSVLEAQQESVDAATLALERALSEAGITAAPVPDHIACVERATLQLRALVSTRSSLATSMSTFEQLERQSQAARRDREALGTVVFEPAAFRELQQRFQEADRAHSALAQIELDLARRPDLESERSTAAARIEELNIVEADLAAQRAALGFDPAELAGAQRNLQVAREEERSAVARYHRTTTALREAELHRDAVVRERERLDRLATTADARQSEADHLDLIAKEFTEFERFAASRKRPILSEYTSHLVQAITDGKYDRVDFDQDFGIIVYDGDDAESSYAVDTFSGGERDAITLAARIALSQMIGRQAANPPGFLVLDEVFGSLDADRRAHLLDMLGSISATFDELRQVFIISHVDDVRTSPVLDELWRIEQTAEGASAVTSLGPGAEIDSL